MRYHAAVPSRGVQLTGAIAAVLAAALIALGTNTPRWWSGEKGDAEWGIGLREFELCGGETCRSRGLEGLGDGSEAWPRLGAVSFAIGWAASLFLLVAAGATLLGRRAGTLGKVAAAVSLFALLLGAGFAWTYPGFDGLGAGSALIAYLGGAALGVGAGRLVIAGAVARPAP